MVRRERKSHLTDPTQKPPDEYKRMMGLKIDRDRDELRAYGRETPNEKVGLREPPYRAFYEHLYGDYMGLSGYKEYPGRVNLHPHYYGNGYVSLGQIYQVRIMRRL